MKAQDWQDPDSPRNQAIAQLAEICAAMGLSWSATEKEFTIALPDVIEQKVTSEVVFRPTTRKTFDISTWGPVGPIEGEDNPLPDDFQLPEYGEKLDEGEPPKGDPNKED
jgi:hypothetical protein